LSDRPRASLPPSGLNCFYIPSPSPGILYTGTNAKDTARDTETVSQTYHNPDNSFMDLLWAEHCEEETRDRETEENCLLLSDGTAGGFRVDAGAGACADDEHTHYVSLAMAGVLGVLGEVGGAGVGVGGTWGLNDLVAPLHCVQHQPSEIFAVAALEVCVCV